MLKKKFKYFLGIVLVGIIAATGLLFYNFKTLQAQNSDYDLAGWLWSDNYGWISLSSDNCKLPDCIPGPNDYGVRLNSNNTVSGYAWSNNVGWICFGETCSGVAPDGGGPRIVLDDNSGRLSGWAKVVSLADQGWISLGSGEVLGEIKGEICYDCKPVCEDWTAYRRCDGKGCQESNTKCQAGEIGCTNVEPCVVYSEEKYERCNTCFSETFFCNNENDCRQPPDSDPVVGGSGKICSDCQLNCHKEFDPLKKNNRIVCDKCFRCRNYGVSSEVLADFSNGEILGWGWNGIKEGSNWVGGAGWVHFNTGRGAFIVYPWLETLYGAIYSSNEVRQRAGLIDNNATYCIFAKDVIRVSSARCEERVISDVNINFPSLEAETNYRNALGKIDYTGLVTPVVVEGKTNKYGNEIIKIGDGWLGPQGNVLDDKVYYREGDLTIGSSGLVFNNAPEDSQQKGNGIIVIDGDLRVNGDVSYNGQLTDDLRQLSSVAWLVRGDVIINGDVKRLAGAFIIMGKGNDCEELAGSQPDYPHYRQNSCGVFFSGESDKSLTSLGLIISRAFDFRRTFASRKQGAERIIYDGRLIANPPPGLEGFVEKLPVIRDFSF
ncbi:MAG: hypothetical protein WC518_00355 [Patescibacteria group bacterium]